MMTSDKPPKQRVPLEDIFYLFCILVFSGHKVVGPLNLSSVLFMFIVAAITVIAINAVVNTLRKRHNL